MLSETTFAFSCSPQSSSRLYICNRFYEGEREGQEVLPLRFECLTNIKKPSRIAWTKVLNLESNSSYHEHFSYAAFHVFLIMCLILFFTTVEYLKTGNIKVTRMAFEKG